VDHVKPGSPASPLRTVRRVLTFIGARAIGDPIAEGSLRENPAHPWPAGLRPIIFAAWTLFAVLAGLAVTAEALRRTPILADGTTSLPWVAVPVLGIAVATALALLFTAAIHVWWVVRVPLLLLIALSLAAAPVTDTTLGLVHQVAVVALLVFAVVRWRARFAFWEFLVALTLIGHLMLLQFAGPMVAAYANESWPLHVLRYWLSLLTVLAVPAALLAAAAMTELVVTTGAWTARGVWEGLRRRTHAVRLGRLLLAGLVVWAVSAEVWAIATNPRRSITTFPTAVLIVPSLISVLWMTSFGGSAISQTLAGFSGITDAALELQLFQMLSQLPLTGITSFLGIILVLVFFITSSDSGSLVIDTIAAGGKIHAPMPQRIFWCSFEGLVAIALLIAFFSRYEKKPRASGQSS